MDEIMVLILTRFKNGIDAFGPVLSSTMSERDQSSEVKTMFDTKQADRVQSYRLSCTHERGVRKAELATISTAVESRFRT